MCEQLANWTVISSGGETAAGLISSLKTHGDKAAGNRSAAVAPPKKSMQTAPRAPSVSDSTKDANLKGGEKCVEAQISAGLRHTRFNLLKLVITCKMTPFYANMPPKKQRQIRRVCAQANLLIE